jgi:hypothetical protein
MEKPLMDTDKKREIVYGVEARIGGHITVNVSQYRQRKPQRMPIIKYIRA